MPDDFWRLNPYLSESALKSFAAGSPPGSNLAGPTKADVWWPKNPTLMSMPPPHDAPEPDASLLDFLNGLAATMTPTPEGFRVSIDHDAAGFANLPPGPLDVPRGWSQQDVAELLRQMGRNDWAWTRSPHP